MVLKKKAMKSSGMGDKTKGSSLLWNVLIIICKVVGLAFLVQGFSMQFTSGNLFNGMVHYTIAVALGLLAWHLHKKKC
mgnify:CR=1 FL=1